MVAAGTLGRFVAPAAVLAAVTLALLLVRHAVGGDDEPTAQVAAAATRPAPPPAARARRATTAPVVGRYHVIRVGDTLGTVADRYETTVAALVELNPGIDPVALQVGQRVRVQ